MALAVPTHPGTSRSATPDGARPAAGSRRRRLLVGATAGLGAALVVTGVRLPWISTFAGLLTMAGNHGLYGQLLMAGAVLAGLLGIAYALRGGSTLRWALGLVGCALFGFAGYLLIQLIAAVRGIDGMVLPHTEPGLYVATAGAALVFATLLLPAADAPAPDPVAIAAAGQAARPADRPGAYRALGSKLRYLAAATAVVAGAAHVPVTPAHLKEAPYIGVSFIALTAACLILAAVLLVSDSPVVWLTLGVVCAAAVAAYVISRSIGLPLMADDVGNWLEPLGVVAVVTETLTALLAVVVLRPRSRALARSTATATG